MRVLLHADIPDELAQSWFQYVRDFDDAKLRLQGMGSFSPDMTLGQLMDAVKVEPPLTFTQIIKGNGDGA